MKKFVLLLMTLMFTAVLAPAGALAGGGGDPFLGEWNLTTNKTVFLEIHKDKFTGKYSLKNEAGEHELAKRGKTSLVSGEGAEQSVYTLDTSSGSLFVTTGGTALEFRKNAHFITLGPGNIAFLFIVGLIGGMVSGFIGSGGAFVLTPGMMSLGVDGLVAVASNMCHKFPKAMVGAYKRYKYGQIDLKLGIMMGASAVAGVLIGIDVQQKINEMWGDAGSNLYVSFAFVVVLVVVGGYVYYDAWKIAKTGGVEKVSKLALKLQSINLWPMITFKRANLRISFWFTVPIGFATGLLAATIAVGGFIGVPGMIFAIGLPSLMASATELVVAFSMGMIGSVKWGMLGLIDIRLTLVILAGSLLGVQFGALGTTYVKDHLIKVVMGTIMLMVAVSRGLAIPTYLDELGFMHLSQGFVHVLKNTSFGVMVFALFVGAFIILKAVIGGMIAERREAKAVEVNHGRV